MVQGASYFPEDEQSAARFDELIEAIGGADSARPQQAIVVADIVRNERLKEMLSADIVTRGVEIKYFNGRQTLKRDNPSIAKLLKVQDQSRRSMMALGLIAREKPRTDSDDDDDDEFDEF